MSSRLATFRDDSFRYFTRDGVSSRLVTLRNGPFDTSHVTTCPYVLPRHATIEFTQFQSSVRSKTPSRVRHGLRHPLAVPVPSGSLELLTQMSTSCHAIACTITTVHNHASLNSFNRIRRHLDQYILYIEPYVVLHAPVIALPHQPNVSQRSLVCSCRSICFTARAHCPRLFDHQLVGLPN